MHGKQKRNSDHASELLSKVLKDAFRLPDDDAEVAQMRALIEKMSTGKRRK